jgi:uncharacterized SAM-binding protein YcdF (DUF218 family)
MFLVLSKLLGILAFPSNVTILFGILGLLLLPTRLARTGRGLAFVSLIALAMFGLSPIGNLLLVPLENRFPAWDAARGAPNGIIVLGGVIDVLSPGDQIMLNEGAGRLAVIPELARHYPNARILFSGGSGALTVDGSAEAKAAARLLESFGISRDRVILEERSRNTVENAVFSKAIIKPKRRERWLLVHQPITCRGRSASFARRLSNRALSGGLAHTWC